MSTTYAERQQWTQQGAQDAAKRTYDAVKRAINTDPGLRNSTDVFLQGSYANHTNTRGDSDVDVVVMSKSTYFPVTTQLTAAEAAREQRCGSPSSEGPHDLRKRVEQALVAYFGGDRVHPKNKCLRVDRRDGYVDADVVPCNQVRRYTSFPSYGSPSLIEGISILPLEGPRIVNYPREHLKNGQSKNQDYVVGERYKPTVRQIKRLRRKAVDLGLVAKSAAPGYLLECMTYNVPNSLFIPDDSQRLVKVLAWLQTKTVSDLLTFKSCDEIHHLFVDDPGGHDRFNAVQVIDRLWELL